MAAVLLRMTGTSTPIPLYPHPYILASSHFWEAPDGNRPLKLLIRPISPIHLAFTWYNDLGAMCLRQYSLSFSLFRRRHAGWGRCRATSIAPFHCSLTSQQVSASGQCSRPMQQTHCTTFWTLFGMAWQKLGLDSAGVFVVNQFGPAPAYL